MDPPVSCPLPWAAPRVPSIPAGELARRRADFDILDVREPDEFEEAAIPGSSLVPLGALPRRLGELRRDRPLAVVCAVGGRSARATELLRAHGFDAFNLEGGMRAWLAHGYDIIGQG